MTAPLSPICYPAGGRRRLNQVQMINLRLHDSATWVDCRLSQLNGRWIGSADAPSGPTIGWGHTADAALRMALLPIRGDVTALLASGGFDAKGISGPRSN